MKGFALLALSFSFLTGCGEPPETLEGTIFAGMPAMPHLQEGMRVKQFILERDNGASVYLKIPPELQQKLYTKLPPEIEQALGPDAKDLQIMASGYQRYRVRGHRDGMLFVVEELERIE